MGHLSTQLDSHELMGATARLPRSDAQSLLAAATARLAALGHAEPEPVVDMDAARALVAKTSNAEWLATLASALRQRLALGE